MIFICLLGCLFVFFGWLFVWLFLLLLLLLLLFLFFLTLLNALNLEITSGHCLPSFPLNVAKKILTTLPGVG